MSVSNTHLFTGQELDDFFEFAQEYRKRPGYKITPTIEICKLWRKHCKDNKRLNSENKKLKQQIKQLTHPRG